MAKTQASSSPGKQQSPGPSRKGAPWSDEEHKAFLNGLKMYGRGQWKQISRYYVPSRTPTQVASHAQKHFLRQSGAQKRRSRFSAVEEAAMAAAVSLPAPPPLMPQQHASALPPPGIGVPSFFGQSLGSLTGASQPQHFRLPTQSAGMLGAAGAMQGGIAMGMPIGVLPPLPSITTASGTELPILPVMPGRINALSTSVPAHPAAASYSACSSGSEMAASKPASPSPSALLPHPSGAAAPAASTAGSRRAARVSTRYTPSGRSQQLFRLLELNEQLTADRTSSGSGGSQPTAAQHQQQQQPELMSVRRVASATTALDTLASLAEAEAASDEEARARSEGSVPAQSSQQQQEQLSAPMAAVSQALLISAF
ncbi:hypothetical protein D9Q98_005572 [Chlorella vulgaris]|uniref:MYB transcription factor n=1 Tax=Chlorella vulgaris TaxID=3077 RepID=A0A9D4TM80_CHLVU|nr:hypothetical protein D9Q98_005572 [Chlorella vulgaris]